MDLGIAGKKALVCGSSRGLGFACASALAQAGVEVTLNGRDRQSLTAGAKKIFETRNRKVQIAVADIGTELGQNAVLAKCPNPDILINNNGGPPFVEFQSLSKSDIEKGLEMNMITPIRMIQKTLDSMVAKGFGRIINITSVSVKMPIQGLDLSSGARAGLSSFLAGVSRSVAHRGVTINQLLPGYFLTGRLKEGFRVNAEKNGVPEDEISHSMIQQVPAKRLGEPEEFGQTCAFLCSIFAGYITGQNILIDGGLHKSAF